LVSLGVARLMIGAAALVAVFPAFTRRTAETTRSRVGFALLLGAAALLLIPIAFIFAAVTIVGIPLALLLLLLYLLLLFTGFIFAGIALGDTGLERMQASKRDRLGWRSLAAALGIAVLALVTYIPVLGGLVAFVALLIGIGAIVAQWRKPTRAQPA
jgi:hypothetical protein